MARLYYPELLNASQKELANFVKWCNKVYGYTPIIIGGWAVWAYTKHSKSIDIDIILPTTQTVHSLLMQYYKANNFSSQGMLTKEYFKEVKTKQGTEKIYLDAASYSNKNILKEKNKIEIPWNLLEKHTVEYKFNGAKARIPATELLLLFKAKALRDRQFYLKTAETPETRYFLESKIEKDKKDILALLKTKIDKNKLEKLLKQTRFKKIFEETITELSA